MSYVLAVDLGTTFTAAAVVRDGGPPSVVTLEHHGTSVPSVLWIGTDGTTLVGTAAARRASTDGARVVREFKRRIGDTTPLLVGGSPYSAEQLSARLLRSIYDTVTQQEGAAPIGMAVTHPANWGPYKLELLNQLLRIAEVGPTVTVTEPEAAAIHYASSERLDDGRVVAVYDLGGGTFDVAVLRKTGAGFTVLGEPEGVERLGGIDFDAAIYGEVVEQLGSALDNVPADDPDWIAALSKLRDECTLAKEALSSAPDAVIEVWLPNGRHQVTVTAERFAQLIEPPVIETVKAVRRALQTAHVAPTDVSRLLLVGGSSRIPSVREFVADELGIPTAVDTHPKHAVVLGAARFAASAAFRDVVPASRIAEVAAPVDTVAAQQREDLRTNRRESLRGIAQQVADLAASHDRRDLQQRMIDRVERLDRQSVRVLVAGDFKQGKSTLVNALIDHEVCPAHPDFATAVPTVITHGNEPGARIYVDGAHDEPTQERIAIDQVGRFVSETEGANPERDHVRSCEVALPVDWLSGGFELVDMPGYGGLDATAGARILAELRSAQAVLFVSDASQELTAPELDFLRLATENCSNVTCVLSKIDNYVDWRLIRDLDTRHLQRAALDVPIVPVSALLHLTATRRERAEFDEESGITDLVRLVSTSIADEVEQRQMLESSIDIDGTLNQLRGVLLSETGALDPQRNAEVVAELKSTLRNVAGLRLDSAGWHRFLRDGVDDLRVSTLDELEAQMHELTTEAESVIAANDPTIIWDEFQSWLRARATKSVSDIYVNVANDVRTLEARLLEQLAHAEAEALEFESGLSSPFMGSLRLDMVNPDNFEDKATNVAIESTWSAAEPLLGVAGFIPGLGPVSLAVAAVAGLVFGRRALRERRARALEGRREQARDHLREYVDEVQRLVAKSIERYSSHLYRGIRDHVLTRTDQLERSVEDALRGAQDAASRSDADRAVRIEQLRTEIAAADQIGTELNALRNEVVSAHG